MYNSHKNTIPLYFTMLYKGVLNLVIIGLTYFLYNDIIMLFILLYILYTLYSFYMEDKSNLMLFFSIYIYD